MPWDTNLINLRDMLAGLYWDVGEARRVAQEAGLNVLQISFQPKPINNWHNILTEAMNQGGDAIQAIIDVARKEYPRNEQLLDLAQRHALSAVRGPDIATELEWKVPEEGEHWEKIIGAQSTLLPIAFLEIGLQKARSVARVVRGDGDTGSGFLTEHNLLVTNHHVLPTAQEAHQARVEFNYQKTADGLDCPVSTFRLDPDSGFATAAEDDWTLVRILGDANAEWGALPLRPATPRKNDRVIIIQHPSGGPKQIAMYHNMVAYVDDRRIQYLTDTLPGSSGSPVFDHDWNVIAVHHSGGWLREPGSKQAFYRNEGIHINLVIQGMQRLLGTSSG
ncbi:MAG: hypothetical protein KatS3mg050_2099 [Litorilinea sp.]|nr:MAG: hypothetical protein KatS3mg050_2099 [Litorilinea sp.]